MLYQTPLSSDELYHFGIKGMKWGVRRYQNKDGSLTPLGRKKYGSKENYEYQKQVKKAKRSGVFASMVAAAGVGAGTAKLASDMQKEDGTKITKDDIFDKSIKQGKGKDNKSPAESITKDVNSLVKDSASLSQAISNKQKEELSKIRDPKIESEIASMSNKDLQDYITRQSLERQYRSLRQPEIQTGMANVNEILQTAGMVTALAVSMASLATTVHKLKRG